MKPSVLFVDDNDMMRAFVQRVLDAEYAVTGIDTAEKAQSWLEEGHMPDLIIADLNLAGMSGLDWLRQLKASLIYGPIPVMILSGKDDSSMRIACYEAGAVDYVLKPFHPKELSIRVARYCSHKA